MRFPIILYDAYPHIVEQIVEQLTELTSHSTKLQLRQVSSWVRDRIDDGLSDETLRFISPRELGRPKEDCDFLVRANRHLLPFFHPGGDRGAQQRALQRARRLTLYKVDVSARMNAVLQWAHPQTTVVLMHHARSRDRCCKAGRACGFRLPAIRRLVLDMNVNIRRRRWCECRPPDGTTQFLTHQADEVELRLPQWARFEWYRKCQLAPGVFNSTVRSVKIMTNSEYKVLDLFAVPVLPYDYGVGLRDGFQLHQDFQLHVLCRGGNIPGVSAEMKAKIMAVLQIDASRVSIHPNWEPA